jgi:hypothetical protein
MRDPHELLAESHRAYDLRRARQEGDNLHFGILTAAARPVQSIAA